MPSIPPNKTELEIAINMIFPKLVADYRPTPASKYGLVHEKRSYQSMAFQKETRATLIQSS